MKKVRLLLFASTALLFTIASLSQVISQNNPNLKDRFYLGPMNFFFDNYLRTTNHLDWYDSLSYNMMQNYCAHMDTVYKWNNTGQKDGGFFEDTSNYSSFIKGVINDWHGLSGSNSLIFEREKILRPAYGQRFTYQAEEPGTRHGKFPPYGYDSAFTGSDYSETWSGENVRGRKCTVGTDTAGFMLKSIYENCGQVNDTRVVHDTVNNSGWERLFSDIKQRKYNMRWYIKPRMRIDSAYAKLHATDTVITIYTKRFDGITIDSTHILCRNFVYEDYLGNKYYNGSYLERFFNFSDSNYLSVSSDSLSKGNDGYKYTASQVDYMVKWAGKVDVWLDYVRVDDSWAHFLFTDTYENELDPNNPNPWKFHRRIKEEVEAFANTDGLGYFWVDEVQYANLECIGEVNRLVKQYSNNQLSLLFITDPVAFQKWSGLRNIIDDGQNHTVWDSCIEKAIYTGALTDIMVTQSFPVFYNKYYPGILNTPNADSFPATAYFNKASTYESYTDYDELSIQRAFSWEMRQHKYFINKVKEKGLIYGVISQINSDEDNIINDSIGWGLREPTNEEISVVLRMPLAYGSKLLLEFSYSTRRGNQDGLGYRYGMGLTSSNADNYNSKRYFNYYGQPKWDFVAGLNQKLKQTGNYILKIYINSKCLSGLMAIKYGV